MKIVIFGLSISSAWGNGHATLLRGLFRALHARGHKIHFFEKDVPYYAAQRDATSFPFADLHLYSNWTQCLPDACKVVADADVGIVTSYCPDGPSACDLILNSNLSRRVFYDMDSPVTLLNLQEGKPVQYLPPYGLAPFDLVLSYTGGKALTELQSRLGAKNVAPLYGWVDPDSYFLVPQSGDYAAKLSYLGTYAQDRQEKLEQLLIAPAKHLRETRFVIGGAMYPETSGWPANIRHFEHVAPPRHAEFYSSCLLTLNVTRGSMASMGYCPSGRLFEAAACGTAVMSDWWTGLDTFFAPGQEILIANTTAESLSILDGREHDLEQIAARARERTLDCHTAALRAQRLLTLLEGTSAEAATPDASACVLEKA